MYNKISPSNRSPSSRIVPELSDKEVKSLSIVRRAGCELPVDVQHVYVKKEKVSGDSALFFVSTQDSFRTAKTGLPKRAPKFHVGQIAYMLCGSGELHNVVVAPGANGCGISGILAEMCMNDEELCPGRGFNFRSKMNEEWPSKEEFLNKMDKDCQKVIFMSNITNPWITASAYFSAALRSGFCELIIWNHSERAYVVLKTADAKKCYVTDDFQKLDRLWYFCRPEDEKCFGHVIKPSINQDATEWGEWADASEWGEWADATEWEEWA